MKIIKVVNVLLTDLPYNMLMERDPKIVPQEISKKLAGVALSAVKPETQVILIGDTNHFRASETIGAVTNQSFWDEIRKTGKKPVFATELLTPEHQPFVNALATGKITKADFVGRFTGESDQMTEKD